jgi:hypothetical protein
LELAAQFADRRENYTEGKAGFVKKILFLAEKRLEKR